MKSKILFLAVIPALMLGCKPTQHWAVTYAGKRPAHYEALTEHFVRTGGCKADTSTQIFEKDSLVQNLQVVHDTVTVPLPASCDMDTLLPNGAHVAINDGIVSVSVPVHDSIHYETITRNSYIRDLSEENLLRGDSLKLSVAGVVKDSLIKEREAKISSQSAHIRKLQFRFYGLIAALIIGTLVTLYLKLKPKISL